MKAIPKHFRLVQEHPNSYEIHDARDKTNFHVAKNALDLGMHAKLSKIQRFDEGGEAETPAPEAPVTVNVNAPEPERAPASVIEEPGQAAPAASSILDLQRKAAGVNPTVVAPAAPSAPAVPAQAPAIPEIPAVRQPGSLVGQARAAQALSERGIRDKAEAESAENLGNAATLQANNDRMKLAFEAYQKTRGDLDTEHQALTDAVVKEKIDPNHWFQSKSVPGKISTAIGIILGGIGAGLQHSNTNQALQVVQDQIKADIDAQKANLGKKQSLLSMNLAKYRNLDAAMAATMTQMNAMVTGQLQLNAARSGTQRAKANADYAIGLLRNQNIQATSHLALEDLKISEMHKLQGTAPQPSAAAHITAPTGAPTEVDSGPSAADILREQNLLSGKKIPIDPLRYGTGVNINKLTALKTTGLLDKEAGHKATEELGKYKKLQSELQEADSVFNIAARNATWRGRIARGVDPHAMALTGGAIGGLLGSVVPGLGTVAGAGTGAGAGEAIGQGITHLAAYGDDKTKSYTGVVKPFADKLAKDITGRSTPISIDALTNTLPEQGDSPEVLAIKRAKLFDLIQTSYTFPTLQEHGLVSPKDPIMTLRSQLD